MRRLIIDNVNNLSGAPSVLACVAVPTEADIICIREEPEGFYQSACHGIRSRSPWLYPLGVLLLLVKPGFWRRLLAAETVILNTALAFPFLIIARLCTRRTVAILHEYSPKNLLYRIGIHVVVRGARTVVTPSRRAYESLLRSRPNWRVIPNGLRDEYFARPVREDRNIAQEIRVLFAGDARPYKGRDLFRSVARALATQIDRVWTFHEVGDPGFRQLNGNARKLSPEIYDHYDFVLVLTDNRVWRETFGVVGCEAASRGCLPLFTDAYAYRELWAPFDSELYLPDRSAAAVAAHLIRLTRLPDSLAPLREAVAARAASICSRAAVTKGWRQLLLEIEG